MLFPSGPQSCGRRQRKPVPVSSQKAATIRISTLTILWGLLTGPVSAQRLPYVPTTILLPNATANTAYIFSPRQDQIDLLALNVSEAVQPSGAPLRTLSSRLPFLTRNHTAFLPALTDNGSLIVFAGDCSSSMDAGLWALDTAADPDAASWTPIVTAPGTSSLRTGPGFLGASLGFSTTLQPTLSPPSIYAYGGMCPSDDSGGSQSNATYSNQMVRLSPSGSSKDSAYSMVPVNHRGSPIPAAGFTLTKLPPSTSNVSGIITQQANYVLLGGHTATAFINMSTAAIWSLPEESWGYVQVQRARRGGAVGDIESRSGHTAVLNAEGNKIVVLGGWVGDLSTAATPQLLILDTGTGYGADTPWQWTIPEQQPPSDGIYGHGAALLPGNVMMVYGGHAIPAASSSKIRRQASGPSPGLSFLNLTSMAWSNAYNNPDYIAAGGIPTTSQAGEDTKKRLGLGLGIGLGLAAIVAAALLYLCYRCRHRRKYAARERAIRAITQDSNRFIHHEETAMEQRNAPGFWYPRGEYSPYSSCGSRGYESVPGGRGSMEISGGNMHGIMQPMLLTRKPVAPRGARGLYQTSLVGNYDPVVGTMARRAGPIHPIYEADEDDAHNLSEPMSPITPPPESAGFTDPFATPTNDRLLSFPPPNRSSRTPSPEVRRLSATDPEVQHWMSDIDAADAHFTAQRNIQKATTGGKVSPTRQSTVRSTRSAVEEESRTGSGMSETNHSIFSRSNSVRRNSLGLGAGTALAPVLIEERQGTSGSSGSSAPSFNTLKSSFPSLQAEGPALLMGRNSTGEDDEPPGSPSKSKPRRGWLGSLRRVFSGQTPSISSPTSPTQDSAEAETTDYDPRFGGLGGIAAGGLLKRRGGREAWLDDNDEAARKEGLLSGHEEDEWDIEKAIEKRLVQVMFTVPKERLRVVNGEPDIESVKDVVVVGPDEADIGNGGYHALTTDVPVVGGPGQAVERGPWQAEEKPDKGKQRETVCSARGTDILPPPPTETAATLRTPEDRPSVSDTRHDSLTSMGSFDPAKTEVLSAAAVKFERPRTRVLAMVDRFEERSRSASPAHP